MLTIWSHPNFFLYGKGYQPIPTPVLDRQSPKLKSSYHVLKGCGFCHQGTVVFILNNSLYRTTMKNLQSVVQTTAAKLEHAKQK